MSVLLLILSGKITAQVIPNYDNTPVDYSFIPAAKGNLVGFVDRENKQVIAPKYEAVSFFNTDGFAVARVGGFDAIIDRTGKEVVPPSKKGRINFRQVSNFEATFESTPIPGIFYVQNETTARWMLFSPGKSKVVSAAYDAIKPRFDERIEASSRTSLDNSSFVFGYKKIVRADAKVNFIDTNFNEVLRADIVNGFPLNENLFAVYNDEGKVGIYKKDGSKLIDPIFHSIEYSGHPDYFVVSVMKNTGYPREGILHENGKLILDTIYTNIRYERLDHFHYSQSTGSYYAKLGIVNSNGKEIIPAEYGSLYPYGPDAYYGSAIENKDIANFKNGQYFILDLFGQVIAGPYSQIQWRDPGTIATTSRNDSILFLDMRGKIKFKLKGDYTVKASNASGLILEFDRKQSLISMDGKVLLEPGKAQLSLLQIDDWVEVREYDANLYGIYSFSKGWIFPLNRSTRQIRYTPASPKESNNILVVDDGLYEYTYTNSAKNVSKKPSAREQGSYTKFSVNKDTMAIQLETGAIIKYPAKDELDPRTNGYELYFEKRINNERIVLNPALKPLFPEGYTLQSVFNINNAYIFHIVNKAQHGGLLRLNGKWIYGPFENLTKADWYDGMWALGDYSNRQLYTQDFIKLSEKFYESSTQKFSSFMAFKERGKSTWDIYSRKGKLLSEATYTGFSSQEGNLVGVEKSGDGDLLSCLTDTLMKEIRCFPYSYIKPLKDDSTYFIVKDLYDYGIINLQGKTIIPFLYKDITYEPGFRLFMLYPGDKTVDVMTTAGQVLFKNEDANLRKNKLDDTYMALAGKQNTYLFNARTGEYSTYSSALGTLRWDKELLPQHLIYFSKDNKNIYADTDSNIVYQIP